MTKRIIYWLFRGALALFAIVPFSLLYKISTGLAWFLQYVIRYRQKVIHQNLTKSFPEKSEEAIKKITKKFYQHLSDIILEGFKGYSVPPERLVPRYRLNISPKLQKYYEDGQSVIFIGGHYNNWEWGVMCSGLQIQHHMMCYYQPISNTFINNFYRQRFSTDRNLLTVSKTQTVKNFVKYRREVVAHILVADQSPVTTNNAIWIDFLNQDTVCIIGPEKLARKFNYPIFYGEATRLKRGYYEMNFTELSANPKTTTEGEITTNFMRMLEKSIKAKPENWLWSHKRWKKKRKL